MYIDILENKHPFQNTFEIITICMEEAEKQKIAGNIKLTNVINTIQFIVETKPEFINETHIQQLAKYLEQSQLINAIETIITASKGFYNLNKKKR